MAHGNLYNKEETKIGIFDLPFIHLQFANELLQTELQNVQN